MISKIKNISLTIAAAIISVLLGVTVFLKSGKTRAEVDAKEAHEEASAKQAVAEAQTRKVSKAVEAQEKAQRDAQKAQESMNSGRRDYFENTKL